MVAKELVQKEVLQFLRDNSTAVVATCYDDVPYGATVYFVVDNDFNFYFITRHNSNKYLNIHRNSKVAMVIGFGPEATTAQIEGAGELITDIDDAADIKERIQEHLGNDFTHHWPIEEITRYMDRKPALFKVTPSKILFTNLDNQKYPNTISRDQIRVFPATDDYVQAG